MTKDIAAALQALIPDGLGMILPPRIFNEMGGEFVAFTQGESLVVRFPNKPQYMNPLGYMQGGMITAAIDNTISPLSYTLGRPNITKEIVSRYKRPVTSAEHFIEVSAMVGAVTEREALLLAEVRNAAGKLVASATACCVFIKPRGTVKS